MKGSSSLSLRLFALTSIFAVIAVAAIALVLSELYRTNVERRFTELLTANLYNLMGSVETRSDGALVGRPNLGDPRFSRFGSGWYWSVSQVGEPDNRLASGSLSDDTIPLPSAVPFDTSFQRQYQYQDRANHLIAVVEAQAYLGTGDDIYSFRVAGNRDEIDEEISTFVSRLIGLLALFALGFIAASYVIVRLGLRPISRATQRLGDIRDGRAERLEGEFPREIQPLIDETNSLIASNRAVIERARTQVGNLAHSLKTPLAVLRNEADGAPPKLRKLVREQTGLMQEQVENYLNRARIAARHGTVTSITPVRPAVDRLVRVISKLNPGIDIRTEFRSGLAFAGEAQDMEEILGNLLENAARFARSLVILEIDEQIADANYKIVFKIEDDGPGMKPEMADIALRRGTRLDESSPGSGLGLSIVNDIVKEYDGSLEIGKAAAGGLAITVRLPGRKA